MDALILSKRLALSGWRPSTPSPGRAYFLSDDFAAYTEINKRPPWNGRLSLLEDAFHKVIREHEEDFLLLSHGINVLNQSDHYWGSRLASRNSASVPFLKYVVYFECAVRLLESRPQGITFICDSPMLAKLIRREAEARGWRTRRKRALDDLFEPLWTAFRLFRNGGFFLFRSLVVWCFVRFLKDTLEDLKNDKERYLIRTWVTRSSFQDGMYKDRNFGPLVPFLQERGIDVCLLPMFFNLDRSIFSEYLLLMKSHQPFILMEQYLSVFDIIKTFLEGIKGILINVKGATFCGRDVRLLIREIYLKSCFSSNLMSFQLVVPLLKKLKQQQVRIDKFLYPIENNEVEKPFILAVKRYYPESMAIAFQHTVWYKEQLGMCLHPVEISYHPLPHKIICSGRRYLDICSRSGFPPEVLRLGGSLRFQISPDVVDQKKDPSGRQKKILVVLNFDKNQAMELLCKVGAALRDRERLAVFLKAHPSLDIPRLEGFLRTIAFPSYEWVTRGTVQQVSAGMDAVIMSGGSVSNLEIMAIGTPLLRISLDNNFDFDPLWEDYPFSEFLSRPEAIAAHLKKAFDLNPEERGRLQAFGKQIERDYFEPVTEENMRVFVQKD